MSFLSNARVIRAPGTVVHTPTDLTDAAGTGEYGGTLIGRTRAVVVQPLAAPYQVQSEGLGEASDVLTAANDYIVSLFLRGWDRNAVSVLLPGGYTQGSTTHQALWQAPGTETPGESALSRAKIWLFVPEDTVHVPCVLVRSGVPDFADGAEIALQRDEEFGLAMVLKCMRDSGGRMLDIGHLEDLTL